MTETTRRYRTMLAAALTAVPLLALLGVRLLWRDELPGEVASHWSGAEPDRITSTAIYFTLALAVCAVCTVLAAVAAARSRATDAAMLLAGTAIVSWALAFSWIVSAKVTIDAGNPHDARLGAWLVLPLLGIVSGLLAFRLAHESRSTAAAGFDDAPVLSTPLGAGERAGWGDTVTNRWPGLAAVALVVAAIVTALSGVAWLAPILLAIAVVGGALTSVTVFIDRSGVSFSSWGVRWKRIPLASITRASLVTIQAGDWGGWGYRGKPGHSALVVRSGDGIELDLAGGKRFSFTVESPRSGAALLNSLIQADAGKSA